MIYSIQTGPNVFFQKLSPDKTVPSLELTKGGPPPAYLKTKPISNPLESDSDTFLAVVWCRGASGGGARAYCMFVDDPGINARW